MTVAEAQRCRRGRIGRAAAATRACNGSQGGKGASCPLIVSRLDRLSRNVHFISGLTEHRVQFIVAALGRDCNNFVLHIYASLGEQERKMISQRTKAGMAAAKVKGKSLGCSYAQRRRSAARKHGISRATYFNWRAKYGGVSVSELKRMKELEAENAKLKRMYAELALENAAIKDLLSRKL
jgi:DNA invertase Pin-like site-specific DNA recombinase